MKNRQLWIMICAFGVLALCTPLPAFGQGKKGSHGPKASNSSKTSKNTKAPEPKVDAATLKKKGRIVKFPSGAALIRDKKKVAKAGKDTEIKKADVIQGAPIGNVQLLFGEKFYAEVVAKAVLQIVRMLPPLLAYPEPCDVELTLKKGAVRFRTSWLGDKSKWIINTETAITAIKGTAFQVKLLGSGATEVIVAEGRVVVSLPGTDPNIAGVVVGPGQKTTIDGQLPQDAVPIGPADQAVIEALFAIPTTGLGGYSAPPNIGAQDVEDVTVLNYDPRPGVRLYNPPVQGSRNVVWPSSTTVIKSIDLAGTQRTIAKDMYLEAISPDGKTVYASKPNKGIWRMDLDGKNLRQITKDPLGEMDLSPDGTRFVARVGWEQYDETQWDNANRRFVKTGKKLWRTRLKQYVVLNASGSGKKDLFKSDALRNSDIYWRRGGKLLYGRFEYGKDPDFKVDFVDGNPSPTKKIATVDPNFGIANFNCSPSEIVSPQGKWAVAGRNNAGIFLRLSDGKTFDIPAGAFFQEYLPKDDTFLGLRAGGVTVTGPLDNPAQMTDANISSVIRYPRDPFYPPVSPNGSLIAFRNSDGNLSIADAANPGRQKDTGIPALSNYGSYDHFDWMSDTKFKFYMPEFPNRANGGAQTENPRVRAIVTLGLKKLPAGEVEGTGEQKTSPILSMLWDKTENYVSSSLGMPSDKRRIFESGQFGYVVHGWYYLLAELPSTLKSGNPGLIEVSMTFWRNRVKFLRFTFAKGTNFGSIKTWLGVPEASLNETKLDGDFKHTSVSGIRMPNLKSVVLHEGPEDVELEFEHKMLADPSGKGG